MKYEQVAKACRRELRYQALGVKEESKIGPLHIPLVLGGVGVGKTSLAKDLALEAEITYVGINSGENSDGTDLTGVPFPKEAGDDDWLTYWAPNEVLYQATQEPTFLHFDDVDKAPPPAQNALIGLCGERTFRSTRLHPGTLLFLSGNRTEDDKHAIALSESMRTRVTPIILEPSVTSFAKWGTETGLVHPVFIGYVQYKPDHIHVISDTAERDTTPRGYREASDQLFNEPEKDWKEIMTLKLGSGVANDCWAYYEIYSKVDVDHVMKHGTPKVPAMQSAGGKTTFDPNNDADLRRFNYAALFAVSHALNKEQYMISKKTIPGLSTFIKNLTAEIRVAFLVQLTSKVQTKLGVEFEEEAKLLMDSLVD